MKKSVFIKSSWCNPKGSTILLLFIFLLFLNNIIANNNLPKLKCYNKEDYNAGRQNWDIDIDAEGIVYFANTDGLLYNTYGDWQLKTMPGKDMVRSVLADKDTIWCGGKEYGYFTKTESDLVFYKLGVLEFDQVWDIILIDNDIVFLTETQVIYYNKINKSTKIYKFYEGIWSITKWQNKIWSIHKNGEIGYLENGELETPIVLKKLIKEDARKIFVHNNQLYIITLEGKIYSFDGVKISAVILPEILHGKSFFSGMSYDDNSFCLATITQGFVRISNNGEVLNSVNSKNGLLDNTVLSMASDELGNVWLGLDYGIAKTELQGPINKIFNGAATYSIKNFKDKTYIATNKGLFSDFNKEGFQLVESSVNQIWSLKILTDELYICHNDGLSKIKNNKLVATSINYTGVFDFVNIGETNYYLFSTYHGLILMEKEGEYFNYIKNLETWGNTKLKYDEINKCIWGEFTNGTIHQLTLNDYLELETKAFPNYSKFFNTENGLYFSNDISLFQYKDGKFHISNNTLIKTIDGPVQALAFNNKGYLAYVQDKEVKLNVLLPDGKIHSYNALLTSLGKNTIDNFEFLDFDNDALILATDRGVTVFDISYRSNLKKNSLPVISSFMVLGDKNRKFTLPYPEEGIDLGVGNKDLKFKFSINKLENDVVEYRYKLEPSQKQWSPWSQTKKEILLPQVGGGSYTLFLQSRINGAVVEETSLKFTIEKLWHQTFWVILPIMFVVFLWVFGVVFVMTRINRRKLNRQKKIYIERNNRKTLQLKNEQLFQFSEIISHKNDFLNKVKAGLENMRNNESNRWVKMISDEVNNEKKDFLFHKLFSEINQDFISRLTGKYPSLTSNDIRVLSFIRINLDKNEICNLMNISPRSLDTSRYRLKKKLNLDKETDLNQFIWDY